MQQQRSYGWRKEDNWQSPQQAICSLHGPIKMLLCFSAHHGFCLVFLSLAELDAGRIRRFKCGGDFLLSRRRAGRRFLIQWAQPKLGVTRPQSQA